MSKERDYVILTYIGYPQELQAFLEGIPIKSENNEDNLINGIFFPAPSSRNYTKYLLNLSSLMFDKKFIDKKKKDNKGQLHYREYIDILFKEFCNILRNKNYTGEFEKAHADKSTEDTSGFTNPYIFLDLDYLTLKLKRINNLDEKNKITFTSNFKVSYNVSQKDIEEGIFMHIYVPFENYSDVGIQLDYIPTLGKLRLTKNLCEDIIKYYESLPESKKRKYKDVYDHIRSSYHILVNFLKSGIDTKLYEPIIRYLIPLTFIPANLNGKLSFISVKFSMFFKEKSPDEVIQDIIKKAQKSNQFSEYIEKLIDEASGNNLDKIKAMMNTIWKSQQEEEPQQKKKKKKNLFLAKMRALFTDMVLYSSDTLTIKTIHFKRNNNNSDLFIQQLRSLYVMAGKKNKDNSVGVLALYDKNFKENDNQKCGKEILEHVLKGQEQQIEVKEYSIRDWFSSPSYLGIDINDISDIELVLPFFEELNDVLRKHKENNNRRKIILKEAESLKLLFMLFYFTVLMYRIVNTSNRSSYIYMFLNDEEYPVIEYVRELYYVANFPIQIITKKSYHNRYSYKNIFFSGLKTFKKTSFIAEALSIPQNYIEMNKDVYVIVEERTELIKDTRHYIFNIYKISHSIINKNENSPQTSLFDTLNNKIDVYCEVSLYRTYISFFTIADYLYDILHDLSNKPNAKIFFVRKSSVEDISFPIKKNISLVNVIDTPLLFLKSGNVNKNIVSVIEEGVENIVGELILGELPDKRKIFAISPSFIPAIFNDFKDSENRTSFHCDTKTVLINKGVPIEEKQLLILDLLALMNFEAEGYSYEGSFAKLDLSSNINSLVLEIAREGLLYATKIGHVIPELVGLIGTSFINRKANK